MEIKWSDFAKENLKYFYELSNAGNYVKKLVDYVGILADQNYLGKTLLTINSTEIRQLVYRKHRILYCISNNEIDILAVLHASQDLSFAIRYIQRFFQ